LQLGAIIGVMSACNFSASARNSADFTMASNARAQCRDTLGPHVGWSKESAPEQYVTERDQTPIAVGHSIYQI
jgi:hypothetical protein